MSEDAQTPFTPSPISARAATARSPSAGASASLLMCVPAQLLWPGRCSRARAPQPSAAAARPPPAACASRAGARSTRRSAYQRRLTSRRRAPSARGRARAPRPSHAQLPAACKCATRGPSCADRAGRQPRAASCAGPAGEPASCACQAWPLDSPPRAACHATAWWPPYAPLGARVRAVGRVCSCAGPAARLPRPQAPAAALECGSVRAPRHERRPVPQP